jgi:hypothetical protein
MVAYFDEKGGESKSCIKKKVVVEKECIREDEGVKTKFKVRVVEEKVRPISL